MEKEEIKDWINERQREEERWMITVDSRQPGHSHGAAGLPWHTVHTHTNTHTHKLLYVHHTSNPPRLWMGVIFLYKMRQWLSDLFLKAFGEITQATARTQTLFPLHAITQSCCLDETHNHEMNLRSLKFFPLVLAAARSPPLTLSPSA